MEQTNYYQMLEIAPAAAPFEIEIAYRRYVGQSRDDPALPAVARERRIQMLHAFATLRDPARRAAYDAGLHADHTAVFPVAPLPLPEIIVSSTAPGGVRSLADALAVAPPGARIRVQPGTYRGPFAVTRPVEIVGDGPVRQIQLVADGADCLTLYAGRAHLRNLTLSAAGEGSAALRVVRGAAEVTGCELSGPTGAIITGATARPTLHRCTIHTSNTGVQIADGARPVLEECRIFAQVEAGVIVMGGAAPTLRQCFVRGAARGIVVRDAAGTYDTCHIAQCGEAGVVLDAGAEPLFVASIITEGAAIGVLAAAGSFGTLRECTITANAGDGVCVAAGGNPTVIRCLVEHNAGSGVAVVRGGGGHIEGCSLVGNSGKAWNVAWGSKVYRRWNKE